MDYSIQSPGEYQYPGFDKPVYFSPEFLASLAKDGTYRIEEEHNGPPISTINQIFFKDNQLWMRGDENLKEKGKGFSTTIKDYKLIDRGERYEIVDGYIDKIARTRDPKDRLTIINNSNNPPGDDKGDQTPPGNNDGDGNMTDELKAAQQKIGALQQELNNKTDEINNLKTSKDTEIQNLKNQLQTVTDEKESLKTQLGEKDTAINEIKKTKKQEAETLAKKLAGDDEDLYGAYKIMPIKELKVIQQKSVEKLAKDLAGEEEDLLEIYKGMSKAELEIIKEKGTVQDTGFNGVGDAGGDDQNNGDGDDDEDETPQSYEDWEKEHKVW